MLTKTPKPKACKVCKTRFTPQLPLQQVCSPQCAYRYGVEQNRKQRLKVKREKLEKLKTKNSHIQDLQKDINKLVRLIDYGHACISCDGWGKPNAGHYHSTAAHPQLRFHLFNIWLQDYHCNVHKSANTVGYNLGLIKSFGADMQAKVEHGIVSDHHDQLNLSIDEIKLFRAKVKEIIKSMPKDKIYTIQERIELRTEFNKLIGIYS